MVFLNEKLYFLLQIIEHNIFLKSIEWNKKN